MILGETCRFTFARARDSKEFSQENRPEYASAMEQSKPGGGPVREESRGGTVSCGFGGFARLTCEKRHDRLMKVRIRG